MTKSGGLAESLTAAFPPPDRRMTGTRHQENGAPAGPRGKTRWNYFAPSVYLSNYKASYFFS